MVQDVTTLPLGRIVWVSRDPDFFSAAAAAASEAGWDCVCAGSGRLAVAELLADPTSVLAIDLRVLCRRVLPMLEVARRESVTMLGTGPLPRGMTAEQLSGITLVASAQFSEALGRLHAPPAEADDEMAMPEAPSAAPEAACPPETAQPPAPLRREVLGFEAGLGPARPIDIQDNPGEEDPAEEDAADAALERQLEAEYQAAARDADARGAPGDPPIRTLLTREELDALLGEDEP